MAMQETKRRWFRGRRAGAPGKKGTPRRGGVAHAPNATDIPREALALVSKALDIVEAQVEITTQAVSVGSTGSTGAVMDAARLLGEAHEAEPHNPLLHYGYASALHLAMQYKTAEEAMRACAQMHPDFQLARFALEGWAEWHSPLTFVPWGPGTTAVHPAIANAVKTCVLLSTRDGILPRATLFFRDAESAFPNPSALRTARVELATVISPVKDPQVIGINGKVYDSPSDPLSIEACEVPFYPRGNARRCTYEYFACQTDLDFAVMDRDDRILFNQRLQLSPRMKAANARLLALLAASEGTDISASEGRDAIMRHQQIISPNDVAY